MGTSLYDQYQASLAPPAAATPAAPPTPTGPPSLYDAYLASKQPVTAPTAPAPAAPRSPLYNALNTVDNAVTGGLGQKFNAGFDALGDVIRGTDTFGHSYTKNLNAEQQGLSAFSQAHPAIAGTLSGVGAAGQIAVAAPLAAAGEVANGLSMGTRALAAAKAGAAFGGINALGNAPASDDIGASVQRGLIGTVGGAALGAGAVPLTEGIGALAGKAVRPLSALVSRSPAPVLDDMAAPNATTITPKAAVIAGTPLPTDPTPVDRASGLLIQRLQRAGLTPQDALSNVANIPDSKPISLMEVAGDMSQPVRQLGKWVARTPSTGAAQLRAAVSARAEPLSSAQRVLGDVSDAMDAPRANLVDNAAQLKGQQLANAQPSYAAAMSDATPPVPVSAQVADGPTLGELMQRPSIKSAIKFHNDVAAERGDAPLALDGQTQNTQGDDLYNQLVTANVAPDKARAFADQQFPPAGEDAIPLQTLQQIKFKLDDALGFAKHSGQLPDGTPATNAKLGAINDTRKALLGIMTQHSPDYAAGNASWAGDAAIQGAGAQGRDFLARPIDELQTQYAAMTPGEQQQHNLTAVSGPIRNRLYNTNAVDRAKILTGPDMQERLQAVVPPSRLAPLARNIATEHEIALTNQQLPGGSDTAENLNNDADVNARGIKSALTGIVTGRPRRVLTAAVRSVVTPAVDSWIHGINEQTANALAPKLSAGMMSRDDLVQVLDDLATKYDALSRIRGSLPRAGALAGVTAGQLPSRTSP